MAMPTESRLQAREPRYAAVVSDMHLEKRQSSQEKLHGLISEVIANKSLHVLLLPGDIIDKSVTREETQAIAAEFGRLKEPSVGRNISTIYVEGNDEQHRNPKDREEFYSQLEEQGVIVFKADSNNVTTVKGDNGEDIASFIGIPWTLPPEVYKDIYFGSSRSDFLKNYREACEKLYLEKFLQDLKQAEEKGVPIYIVFHVPPFAEPFGLEEHIALENMQMSTIVQIINDHPFIAGGFFGHINEGQSSVVETPGGVGFMGVCEEVIREKGKEHTYLACKLPHPGQHPQEAREEFYGFMREYEITRRQAQIEAARSEGETPEDLTKSL